MEIEKLQTLFSGIYIEEQLGRNIFWLSQSFGKKIMKNTRSFSGNFFIFWKQN